MDGPSVAQVGSETARSRLQQLKCELDDIAGRLDMSDASIRAGRDAPYLDLLDGTDDDGQVEVVSAYPEIWHDPS